MTHPHLLLVGGAIDPSLYKWQLILPLFCCVVVVLPLSSLFILFLFSSFFFLALHMNWVETKRLDNGA